MGDHLQALICNQQVIGSNPIAGSGPDSRSTVVWLCLVAAEFEPLCSSTTAVRQQGWRPACLDSGPVSPRSGATNGWIIQPG
jgi:hypothetical protein